MRSGCEQWHAGRVAGVGERARGRGREQQIGVADAGAQRWQQPRELLVVHTAEQHPDDFRRGHAHERVAAVHYPGLPSHPQHKLAKKQMSAYGGMVTIEVKGGVRSAVNVCDSLKVAINAMSLGGVETLVSIPVYSSHINMSKAELATHGVTPGMIRISVGVEGIDDLIADSQRALLALAG